MFITAVVQNTSSPLETYCRNVRQSNVMHPPVGGRYQKITSLETVPSESGCYKYRTIVPPVRLGAMAMASIHFTVLSIILPPNACTSHLSTNCRQQTTNPLSATITNHTVSYSSDFCLVVTFYLNYRLKYSPESTF